jgi:hypothetical protein
MKCILCETGDGRFTLAIDGDERGMPLSSREQLASTPRARPHNGSAEETERRRRRREAMVLNDGDRPIAREDIIQREGNHDQTGEGEARRTERALQMFIANGQAGLSR